MRCGLAQTLAAVADMAGLTDKEEVMVEYLLTLSTSLDGLWSLLTRLWSFDIHEGVQRALDHPLVLLFIIGLAVLLLRARVT